MQCDSLSYKAFIIRRFSWATKNTWGLVERLSGIIGIALSLIVAVFFDWSRQNISERMNAILLTAIPLAAGFSVFVIRWIVSAHEVWKEASLKVYDLEKARRPKLKVNCGEMVAGSRGKNKSIDSLRIVLAAEGEAIENCEARLVEIRKGNEIVFEGNSPNLTFCPAEASNPLIKTIYPGPATYIDVIYVFEDGRIAPGTLGWNFDKTFDEIIDEYGDYSLVVQLVGKMPTVTVPLKFAWTGDWKSSRLEKL